MKTTLHNIHFELLDLNNVKGLTPQNEKYQSTPGEDITTPIDPEPYIKPGRSIIARGDYISGNLTQVDIVVGFIGIQVSPFSGDLAFVTRPQISGTIVNLNAKTRDNLKAKLVEETINQNGKDNSFFFLFDTSLYTSRVPSLSKTLVGAGGSYGHELEGTVTQPPIMENLQTGLLETTLPVDVLVTSGTRFGWPTRIEHTFTIISNGTPYGVVREDQIPQVINRDGIKTAVENSLKMEQKLAIQDMVNRVPKSRFRREGFDKETIHFVNRWRFTHRDKVKGLKF